MRRTPNGASQPAPGPPGKRPDLPIKEFNASQTIRPPTGFIPKDRRGGPRGDLPIHTHGLDKDGGSRFGLTIYAQVIDLVRLHLPRPETPA